MLNHAQVTHSPNRYQESALFDTLYRWRTIVNTLDHTRCLEILPPRPYQSTQLRNRTHQDLTVRPSLNPPVVNSTL